MAKHSRLPLPGAAELPLVLSPMVDVTDAAFRSLAREWGADVTCSEMVAAVGLVHGSKTAWRHVQPWPGERPYGVQFMTGDPAEMADAVRQVAEVRPDFVDVNLGCPAPNIMNVCAGGFLMRDPEQAQRVIRAAVEAAEEAGIPHVSVKMRLGPAADRLTYLDVGARAEREGAAWATLHARTVAQGYTGQADWSHIRALAEALAIPVVGNGDLRTPADVVRMRDETGCAGFFIARAAMHDPTIFQRMRAALQGQQAAPEPGMAARLQTLLRYVERAEGLGLTNMGLLRRQTTRFVAGAPGARLLRQRMQSVATPQELRDVVVQEQARALPAPEAGGPS